MDRDKLIELIQQTPILMCGALRADYAEAIADHLIANGIGDITAEKHRADVAEETMVYTIRTVAKREGEDLATHPMNRLLKS